MAWTQGNNNIKPVEDINAKLAAIEGDMTEEEARAALGEFLFANPAFMLDLIAGVKIFPMQEILLKGWMRNDYNLAVWGRGLSKCIDQNAEVLTDYGFTKIKDVQIGDRIWADNDHQEVLNKWTNPEEDGFSVETKRGFEFTGKIGHKTKVLNPETLEFEFKNIEQFTGSEIIPIRIDMEYWPKVNLAHGYDNRPRVGSRELPVIIENTDDLHYLMGLILGDGCITHKKRIIITNQDTEVVDFCVSYLSKILPGNSVSVVERGVNRTKQISVESTGLIRFLEYMGFAQINRSDQKEYPRGILQSNKMANISFLQGLFDTDGYASYRKNKGKNRGVVGLTSTCLSLLKSVQSVLLNLGIVSGIHVTHKGGAYVIRGNDCNTKKAYSLQILGRNDIAKFIHIVGFKIKRKQDTAIEFIRNCGEVSDNYPVGAYLRKKYKHYHFKKHGFRIHPSVSEDNIDKMTEMGFLDGDDIKRIEAVINSGKYYYDVVKTITPVKTTTVDITVDKEACYWSNGIIHHNSWTCALFAILWGIYNPNHRIVIISFAFRASRRILEQCEKFVNDSDAALLKACFPQPLQRKTDEWKWVLPNGSSITCLPLGDGKKIRGVRADTLIVDEYAFLPESIIGEILRPFLASKNKIKEQLKQREREDELIAQGRMTEDQREIIEDRKKVIFLSSASYTFEHMYKTYCDWVDLLTKETRAESLKESGVSYFISRLGWESAPQGLLDLKEIEEARRNLSESMFNREYGAIFEGDSDGYFRAAKMQLCSVEDGGTPTLELVGDKLAEYVLAIDPSLSGSETSDHFAMCVLKIVQRLDGKKIGMVVHSYAVAGGNLKDHTLYLHYLLTNFNIVYMAIDASQGDEVEFINMCNQSEQFKKAKIELIDIECEFSKDNFSEMPAQVRKSYNRTIGRIVQKQPFGSPFQKAANEYLQGCFDHKGVMFGAKIAANSAESQRAIEIGTTVVTSLLKDHEELGEMSPSQFIEHQDYLLDLTRKECSMIQVKQSSLGTQNWDLPQSIKRTTGANKTRKDSYSALLLGNWAVKMYLDSLTIPAEAPQEDFPYLLV